MIYNKTVLDNGVRIVTERHPSSRTVAAGIWVCTGTRDESSELMGISHFLEHLVFKGTKKRNAYQIARAMEAVGGELNAYTTREYTCYHATSLKEDLDLNLDVLSDLVCFPRFTKRDFDRERHVVLQEIAMTEDSPEELIYDIFFERVYRNPLGWRILGNDKTLKAMKRKDVLNYYKQHYAGNNLIVSVAGNVEHDKVVSAVARTAGQIKAKVKKKNRDRPRFKKFSEYHPKDMEQAHVLVGFPTTSFMDPMRFEAFILNTLLGGGMTSKLYQRIRERRGLAYAVHSQLTTFMDVGLCMVYAGTDPKHVRVVIETILSEMERVKKRKISQAELDLYRTQLRGSILLGADDIENRMNSLGVNEMVFNEYRSIERVIEEIEQVTAASMKEYLRDYFDTSKLAIFVMGNENDKNAQFVESL